MSQQFLSLGSTANDRTGDSLRTAGGKINAMMTAIYACLYVPTRLFNAQQYGWLPDGTDRSAEALALLATVYAPGGGTILFPQSTGFYRADSQLQIPHDGASVPAQPNIRMVGQGGA